MQDATTGSGTTHQDGPYLNEAHLRELCEESGIDRRVIAERGYATIDGPAKGDHTAMERLEKLGIPAWALTGNAPWPGLLIPWHPPAGEREPSAYQFKPRQAMAGPKGKPMKYASQKGATTRLDVHPRWSRLSKAAVPEIRDVTRTLIITEGIKKADSLTSRGFVTVAINGVDNWRRSVDWNDIALKGRKVVLAFDADARTNRNVRRALAELTRWLKQVKQVKQVYYCLPPAEFHGKPTKGVDDFFAAGATPDDFKALAEISLPADEKQSASPFTDALMAERYAEEVLAGAFLYVDKLGWMLHTEGRYAEVSDEVPVDAMRRHAIDRYGDALIHRGELIKQGAPKEKQDKAQQTVEGWYSAQSVGKLKAALTLAKGIEHLREKAERFDAVPHLLNTPAGVLDLRTLETTPHSPNQRHTKITGVAYVPGAESAALKKALESIPPGTEDWFQAYMGEAATGRGGDQLLLLTGGGDNGKTLIMGAAFEALGDYAAKVPNTLLLKTRNVGAATPEKMTLRGTRLAYMEETPEESYLDANMVKDLLDAKEIEGRQLYKGFVSWTPTHSLILNTNHIPTMVDTGHGAWRRVARLHFPYKYVGAGEELTRPNHRRADPLLKAAMATREALEALLAWMVAGAQRALSGGTLRDLEPPAEVLVAVQDWRSRSDDLMTFVDMHMVQGGEEMMCAKQDFFIAMNKWLKDQEKKPWTLPTFVTRLRGHSVLGEEITERDKVYSANLVRPYWVDGDSSLFDDARPVNTRQLLKPLASRTAVYVGVAFKRPDTDG